VAHQLRSGSGFCTRLRARLRSVGTTQIRGRRQPFLGAFKSPNLIVQRFACAEPSCGSRPPGARNHETVLRSPIARRTLAMAARAAASGVRISMDDSGQRATASLSYLQSFRSTRSRNRINPFHSQHQTRTAVARQLSTRSPAGCEPWRVDGTAEGVETQEAIRACPRRGMTRSRASTSAAHPAPEIRQPSSSTLSPRRAA